KGRRWRAGPRHVCVDFELPLPVGTSYEVGPAQPSGTVIFTSSGIPVAIHEFKDLAGNVPPGNASIAAAPAGFGSGQVMRVNNISLEFDFTNIGFTPSQVQFDYLDQGGTENF